MSRGVLWPQGFQRLLLGVLSPLCFSLLLGHILRISDTLPLSDESRRSEPEAASS